MSNGTCISRERFVKRLADLSLRSGLTAFPKGLADQHILLKSAALLVRDPAITTEKQVDERLKYWIEEICHIDHFDHTTLRRWLVDAGYLARSNDGSSYRVSSPESTEVMFEDGVEQVDVPEVIRTAREEIARRKAAYMAKGEQG